MALLDPSDSSRRAPGKGALYALLGVLGAVTALIGSFHYAWSTWATVIVLVATFLVVRLSGWAAGTRTGAVIPAIVWVVVVGVLSAGRPEGDVIITSSLQGYLFLLGGCLTVLLAVLLTPATRSFLTGQSYGR